MWGAPRPTQKIIVYKHNRSSIILFNGWMFYNVQWMAVGSPAFVREGIKRGRRRRKEEEDGTTRRLHTINREKRRRRKWILKIQFSTDTLNKKMLNIKFFKETLFKNLIPTLRPLLIIARSLTCDEEEEKRKNEKSIGLSEAKQSFPFGVHFSASFRHL